MERRLSISIKVKNIHCRVCCDPLRSPVFECAEGHFFCETCRDKSPEATCPAAHCDAAFNRSYGMELTVGSVRAHCAYAEHGCTAKVIYYDKQDHEKACPHAPLVPCPASGTGCGFVGRSVEIWGHLLSHFDRPPVYFNYFQPFRLPVEPGWRVLRSIGDGEMFVLNVQPLAALGGHGVALVCIGGEQAGKKYGCSLSFSCFSGHDGTASLGSVPCTTTDVPPTDYFCLVPKPKASDGGGGVVLTVTIDTEMDYDSVEELEEDDDDTSCQQLVRLVGRRSQNTVAAI